MAAKYWPRKAATDEASGSCEAPVPTVTAPPSEGLAVADGLCADAEALWAAGEAPCVGGVDAARVDWVEFDTAPVCDA